MKQKTFRLGGSTTLNDMIRTIRNDTDYQNAAERGLLVLEPDMDRESTVRMLEKIQTALPDLKIFGMTLLGPLSSDMALPDRTVCSLLLFDSPTSRLSMHVIDCHERSSEEAGKIFLKELGDVSDLRGIQVMNSDASLCPSGFLTTVSAALPSVPLFGDQAGTLDLADDQSIVICGSKVYDRAILAVTFSGEDLHVFAKGYLGWRPLGISHVITDVAEDNRIVSIDGKPAVSLYSEYLDIHASDHFLRDNAPFPMVEWIGDTLAARVCLTSDTDGSLRMLMPVPAGTHISLSYTKPGYLLEGSLGLANETAQFLPEAVIVSTCLNRRLFLGNGDADREISYFRRISHDACWGYGLGEILRVGSNGGFLNSTIVVVALREGDGSGSPVRISDPLLEDTAQTSRVDRLVTFLERTTKDLQNLADRDQLTGLANRRTFDQKMESLLESRTNNPLSLFMFDVDHFKYVNDTHGHTAGDKVLKRMAAVVSGSIRGSDFFCRWGGEEFVCILSGTKLKEADRIANRIRKTIEMESFGDIGHVTVSMGVVAVHDDDTTTSLFARLDEMLYRAKAAGRNCVVSEDGTMLN